MDDSEAIRKSKILSVLKKEYPNTKPALHFGSPFELLIATILSAQCTDKRVNIVTKKLFNKYKFPEDYLKVEAQELERDIYSTGFYKSKAKNIRACCRKLIGEHGGKVPPDFKQLTMLPGVGRKTASVVAGNAFGIPAIAVDTHVKRISNLLGFVDSKNPNVIEKELKLMLPEKDWINYTHWIISHGRKTCIARRPKCSECVIAQFCPAFKGDKRE